EAGRYAITLAVEAKLEAVVASDVGQVVGNQPVDVVFKLRETIGEEAAKVRGVRHTAERGPRNDVVRIAGRVKLTRQEAAAGARDVLRVLRVGRQGQPLLRPADAHVQLVDHRRADDPGVAQRGVLVQERL